MKTKFKKYLPYIIWIVILIIIVVLAFAFTKDKNKTNYITDGEITNVIPKEVSDLYDNLTNVNCHGSLTWDKDYQTSEMSTDRLLDLIFKYLDLNGNLTDTISKEKFDLAKNKVLGANFPKIVIKDYNYAGNVYTLDDKFINRLPSTCDRKNYVSSLHGYTYNKVTLSLDVNVGILIDNVIYNMNNEPLGTTADNLDKLLDLSEGYTYNYKKEGNDYYLVSVKKIIKEIRK